MLTHFESLKTKTHSSQLGGFFYFNPIYIGLYLIVESAGLPAVGPGLPSCKYNPKMLTHFESLNTKTHSNQLGGFFYLNP
ncbi:MAG: hypothetical protein KJO49_10125, partial [Bacteroidia bacterium]|nr:hypothetical protein [Bacteroidia bacterium]